MTDLVIGCPVLRREWVLPAWFDHVERACADAGVVPGFVFVCDPRDPSLDVIRSRAPQAAVVAVTETRSTDRREWHVERYRQMVVLRNQLLAEVRRQGPELFLSLDSDILLGPGTLSEMLTAASDFDAVGARCYMTASGTRFPSWGLMGRDGSLIRMDATGTFSVDVIMAIKLMSPSAYNIDYVLRLEGEDVGWSNACRAAGLRLGWTGHHPAKHIVQRDMLERVDPRVGF
jgi:hypothetical protein